MDNLDQTTPAAEYAQDQKAQAVVWSGFEWWRHSQGVSFTNVTRTPEGFGVITEVGGLFAEVRQ